MIDGRNFIDPLVKNDLKTYDHIQKIAVAQGDDYTTVCVLDYLYFKEYYMLIAIDLENKKLDAHLKAKLFYWKSRTR